MVPKFQVATACFSCSPPDINLGVQFKVSCISVINHCHRVKAQLQLNKYYYYYYYYYVFEIVLEFGLPFPSPLVARAVGTLLGPGT